MEIEKIIVDFLNTKFYGQYISLASLRYTIKELIGKDIPSDELLSELIKLVENNPDDYVLIAFNSEDSNIIIADKKGFAQLAFAMTEAHNKLGTIKVSIYNPDLDRFSLIFDDGKLILDNDLVALKPYLFANTSKIESVLIDQTVTALGPGLFQNSAINKVIMQNKNIMCLSENVFFKCSLLVDINQFEESNIILIEAWAFGECACLSNLKLPHNLERIEEFAFAECVRLKNIYIPDSVKFIDHTAFIGCSTKLVVHTKNPYVITYCQIHGINYNEEV